MDKPPQRTPSSTALKGYAFLLEAKRHLRQSWGLVEFRNLEAEEKDFHLLRQVFGDVVELRRNSKNAKHPFQKTLKLPF